MRTLKFLLIVFVILFACFFLVKDRVVINPTSSMAIGLYWRYDKLELERGDIVLACLPDTPESRLFIDRGYFYAVSCPGGRGKILKRVSGIPGDDVSISQLGVTINGQRIKNSVPLVLDSRGRKMPYLSISKQLKANEYILTGENALSLDSRYFGPIKREQILFPVRPLWISGG